MTEHLHTLGELERVVLSQQPIHIPQNPFYEVLTRFGKDEAMAMLVNVVGTAGLAWAMEQGMGASLSKNDRDVVLAATGPVIEKVGFFPAHLKEAWEVYKTTPQDEREAFSHYLQTGIKEGSKSLLEDVLIHDPMYGVLMYKGLQMYPQTPAWMMATLSFVAAVFAVAGLEVGYNELQYVREKRKWKKAGFGEESYYEARFLMSSEQKKENFLFQMERDFSLSETMVGKYHDVYIPHTLPTYSGRNARLRLRQRVLESEGREVKTAQIVYTRAAEMATKTQEQFRYFLSRKDKLYLRLEGEMPSTIEELADVDVRAKLQGVKGKGEAEVIDFERTVARTEKGLFVAVDTIERNSPFYIVELKVHSDTQLLQHAMRYVMLEFPVLHTTQTKYELVARTRVGGRI